VLSYDTPPTHNVALEEFESCAIDRLRVLGEIEACFARNRPPDERKTIVKAQCHKYLPLDPNDSLSRAQFEQRRRDHVGHFVLRLAFCRSCVACHRLRDGCAHTLVQ
jgi:DNA primase large subunit